MTSNLVSNEMETIAVESHSLPFQEFDLRVDVMNNGDVWVVLSGGGDLMTFSVDDLSKIVAFTETHGQVTVK